MGVEGKLEQAERLVSEIEEAQRDVSRRELELAAAQRQAAAARSRAGSADKGEATRARDAAREADAAASAARASLERARRRLGTAQADREELGRGMRRYIAEQNRATRQLRVAMAAAPYGGDRIGAAHRSVAAHAHIANRVLEVLGMGTELVEEGDDLPAPSLVAGVGGAAGGGGVAAGCGDAAPASSSAGVPYRTRRADGAPRSALDECVERFRFDLRESFGWADPPEGMLYPPEGAPLVGFDERERAQGTLDKYENELGGAPGSEAVMRRLREEADRMLAPASLDQPYRYAFQGSAAPPDQPEHCNPYPRANIEAAYLVARNNFGSGSPEATEAAWRYADTLERQGAEARDVAEHARSQREHAEREYYAFCDAHATSALTASERLELERLGTRRDQTAALEQSAALLGEQVARRRAEVTSELDPESRTTFVGIGGATDFEAAYAPFLTQPQGYEYDDTGGCCGIGTVTGMVNEQTGTRYGWAHGICEFIVQDKASYVPMVQMRECNGGTSPERRCEMLERHGLEAHNCTFGCFSKSSDVMSLDDLLELRQEGYSVGLALKAQDLLGPTISPRLTSTDGKGWQSSWRRNHSVTVAGVSVDRSGRPTGVWINDTGGWSRGVGLRTNRIFVSRERYEAMVASTENLSVEWARPRRGTGGDDDGTPPARKVKKLVREPVRRR
ncbi:hypothetical protein ACULPM_06450 [Thermophilibacter sp. ZX-H3]|uniref:hypothetical protein n=1 Tax=unclassified Thermophilibacter TaxID=2847308 RepID=UPI004040ABE5